jgi:hypothetical protein
LFERYCLKQLRSSINCGDLEEENRKKGRKEVWSIYMMGGRKATMPKEEGRGVRRDRKIDVKMDWEVVERRKTI